MIATSTQEALAEWEWESIEEEEKQKQLQDGSIDLTMHPFKCLFVRDRERWPRGKITGNAVALAVAFELQLH